MQVYTETKQKRFNTIAEMKAEFFKMKQIPGSQKTAIYKALAEKYRVTERTVINYLKK